MPVEGRQRVPVLGWGGVWWLDGMIFKVFSNLRIL